MNAPVERGATAAPHHAGSLTILQGTALYIGAVLGTGVIALPALAAEVAGPASLLAWAALVVLSIPLAATFAALGARYADAGGVSTYVRNAFGAKAAAVVGWCFYFAVPAGAPAAAMFGGAYVAAVTGGGHATMIASAAALIAIVAAANAFGVTVSGRMQLVLSALLVALLVAAVLASAPHARAANLHPFAPHGWLAVGQAAALLVWSFAGWEAITHLAAEFRRPAHDLPRSTGIAVAVVGLLYLSVAAASVLVLGPAAGASGAPLAARIARGIGGNAQLIATAAALLLTLGTMNAYFAGAAKLGAALGRDGALPRWFAQGSQTGGVPRRSLAVLAALAGCALAATVATGTGPKPLVLATSGNFVMVYVLGSAAATKLLPRGGFARRASVVAFLSSLLLLATTGWYLLWPLLLTAAAIGYLRVTDKRTAAKR
ncbi:amino acid permease [Burkholderia thailandensis]|uniref:APC family permease n=1 Tax=Burkholderia thailandensis TaxID=57975 RepID=UPI00148E924A|nr:amino acid permease [Burkholderia thailandensis]NOK51128.1 amino acid permease [Burkholderia thailandensis]